jgi:hypothetical protein
LNSENIARNNNQALAFVDSLETGVHSAIFYEEPEYAHMLEYRYTKIGLMNGETCVYTTHEKDEVEIIQNGMADFGIDVDYFKKKNLLHIMHITDPRQDREGLLQGVENLRKDIMDRSKTPLRLVSRFIKSVDDEDGKVANMFVERTIHSAFEKYNGSFMCPYPVSDIKSAIEGRWMQNHLRNHHAAIFVFKGGKGLAFGL